MPILRHCLASIRNLSVGLKEAADSRIDMYVSTVDRGGRDAPENSLWTFSSLMSFLGPMGLLGVLGLL